MLKIKQIYKEFGALSALNGIDLDVKEGEFFGLIGPNGSGKTTLFNIITGFLRPDKGSIEFNGEEITGLPPHKIVKRGIARTFQISSLFPRMTVLEHVKVGQLAATNAGITSVFPLHNKGNDISHRELNYILELMRLNGKQNELAISLSPGEQRRTEIARALATNPRILLLDEPSAGMNLKEKEELMGDLSCICQSGKTLIVIEHDMDLVMELTNHIAVLNFGVKIAEGSPYEIQNNRDVVEAYLGKE